MREGDHAFLGASKYSWLNYDEEKLSIVYRNHLATLRGTRLHAFAAECISLGQKLPTSKKTLNKYVNDAVGFRMTPEQVLYYSDNCFGTTDAISFKNHPNKESGFRYFLRIHDLKTGDIPAHMEQLRIYASLFCLEYDYNPFYIGIELRIYQSNEVKIETPDGDIIIPIMEKIKTADKIISKIIQEEK